MRWFIALGLLPLAAAIVGCSSGVTDADQKALEAKYSQAEYEKAMIANGRGAELEEQKRISAERQGDR